MKIRTKRVYEAPARADGRRILVDRIWPRGVSKEKAAVDYWSKDTSPSTELRKWYEHDHDKWEEFKARYFAELDGAPDAVEALRTALGQGTNTLVFGSKETELNNATALKVYLESR